MRIRIFEQRRPYNQSSLFYIYNYDGIPYLSKYKRWNVRLTNACMFNSRRHAIQVLKKKHPELKNRKIP
jgi:hypothetical protein